MQNEQSDSSAKPEHLTGHQVVDSNHRVLGEVSDVLYDDASNEARWMVIKPGMLRAGHYAPVEGSYVTNDGRVVVPFDKHWLHTAPKATGLHVLDSGTLRQLTEHYDLSSN